MLLSQRLLCMNRPACTGRFRSHTPRKRAACALCYVDPRDQHLVAEIGCHTFGTCCVVLVWEWPR